MATTEYQPLNGGSQSQIGVGRADGYVWNPSRPRALIVSDDDALSEVLEVALLRAGLIPERVKSMTAGCESSRSGRFQVVMTGRELADGTWKRLIDIARRRRPGFVIIVVTNTPLEVERWNEALEEGAFDVVDALHELPKLTEVVKRASWAAYLEGAGPNPELPRPSTAT